jgi:hypothetical protein
MTWPNKTLCLIVALFCMASTRHSLAQRVNVYSESIPTMSVPSFQAIAGAKGESACKGFYGGYAQEYTTQNADSVTVVANCLGVAPQYAGEQYMYVYFWIPPTSTPAYAYCGFSDGPWNASELTVYAIVRCPVSHN